MRNASTRVVLLVLAGTTLACAPRAANVPAQDTTAAAPVAAKTPYGANPSAGGTFTHDGVTLYYESYGQGDPLLLIHGNGASIGTFGAQIDHFRTRYRVIAMDSRDQG